MTFALAVITQYHTPPSPTLLETNDQANESAHWFCYILFGGQNKVLR